MPSAPATHPAAPDSTPHGPAALTLDDATALARLLMAGVTVTPGPLGWRGQRADRTAEAPTLAGLWAALGT